MEFVTDHPFVDRSSIRRLHEFVTDHPFVDWYTKTQDEGHFNIFHKESFFGLDDYQFWECRFTKIYCAKGEEFM